MALDKQAVIEAIEKDFSSLENVDLNKLPFAKKLIASIVTNVFDHIKDNAEVTVPAQGLITPQGAVTGQAQGTIS